MISLVTLAVAKVHLHVINSDHDADIELKIAAASDMVMSRLKYASVPDEWISNASASPITYDIPERYKHYTLLIVGELFFNRESSVFNIETVLSLIDNDGRFPTLA